MVFHFDSHFINGEPIYKGSCRTNIDGYHITDYLKQLLHLNTLITCKYNIYQDYVSIKFVQNSRLCFLNATGQVYMGEG